MRANQVYQDYISDRHHTHMNSTQVSDTCNLKFRGKTEEKKTV